jgi:hypothetical protein
MSYAIVLFLLIILLPFIAETCGVDMQPSLTLQTTELLGQHDNLCCIANSSNFFFGQVPSVSSPTHNTNETIVVNQKSLSIVTVPSFLTQPTFSSSRAPTMTTAALGRAPTLVLCTS